MNEVMKETDRHTDRQTDRQAGRQTGRQTDRHVGWDIDKPADTVSLMHKHTQCHTYIHTYTHIHTYIDIHTYTHIPTNTPMARTYAHTLCSPHAFLQYIHIQIEKDRQTEASALIDRGRYICRDTK